MTEMELDMLMLEAQAETEMMFAEFETEFYLQELFNGPTEEEVFNMG